MKYSKAVKALQFIAGTVGLIIGAGMTFVPVEFQSSAGIELGNNINLLSETRAPGGLLLIGSMIILASIFKNNLRHSGLVLTSLMYFGYGFGRTISMVLDGMPHQTLIIAMALELIIGVLAFGALLRSNNGSTV